MTHPGNAWKEHIEQIRAAHGLGDDRPAVVEGSTAAAPVSSFEPPEEPEPYRYLFHRTVSTGRGTNVEVVVWEDRPDAVYIFNELGEHVATFSRDAAHTFGLAIADAIHRRT